MKKLLALVLALVMVMGLSVTANATSFADDASIDHEEAVEVMNALNIINGKENNNFDPDGNVKRSEMAKMVTIALLGDVDVSAFTGTATDLTDINGHWAEGYIKYCYSQGIIGGRGNGKFDPEANVTTAEASKMLLVALGYNADVRKYVGENWTVNVARDAQQKGLYKEITNLTSGKAMDRDDAAQLIYNTLSATRVVAVESYDSEGKLSTTYRAPQAGENATLLAETFGGNQKIGYITATSYDATKKLYAYTTSNNAFGADYSADADRMTVGTVYSETDYSALYGQKVTFVYKDAKTVYGIYSDAAILAEGTVGSLKDATDNTTLAGGDNTTKISLGGTAVTLDVHSGTAATGTNMAVNAFNGMAMNANQAVAGTTSYVSLEALSAGTGARFSKLVAIDNDDDGKADAFVLYPVTASEVTYVGSTSISAGANYKYNKTTENYSTTAATAPFYTFYDGVAKNDWALIPTMSTAANITNNEVTKIEKLTGKVTGERNGGATNTGYRHQIQIDGTWYTDVATAVGSTAPTMLGNTYDIYAAEGYMVAFDVVTSASTDVAIVLAEEAATDLTGIKAKLMFPDGSTDTVEISKIGGTNVANTNTLATTGSLTALDNTADSDRLITYKKLDNGTYDVKKVSATNLAGYDKYINSTDGNFVAATSSAVATLDSARIADDAVIFVQYNNGTYADSKYTVVTGADLKTYTAITTVNVEALYGTTGGVDSIKVAYMTTNAANFGTSSVFAYVTSTPYSVKDGSTTYYTYDVWTKDGAVTVKDTTDNSLVKGDLISYVANTNGSVTSTKLVEDSNYEYAAVTGYSEADNALVIYSDEGAKYFDGKISDKTVILYVDTENHAGADGGSIVTARESTNGTFYQNALAVYNYGTSGRLDLLVIDPAGTYGGNNVEIGYTVAAATLSNAPTGTTITTDITKGLDDAVITITVVVPSGVTISGGDDVATLTATGADGLTGVSGGTSQTGAAITLTTETTTAAQTLVFTAQVANATVSALTITFA